MYRVSSKVDFVNREIRIPWPFPAGWRGKGKLKKEIVGKQKIMSTIFLLDMVYYHIYIHMGLEDREHEVPILRIQREPRGGFQARGRQQLDPAAQTV